MYGTRNSKYDLGYTIDGFPNAILEDEQFTPLTNPRIYAMSSVPRQPEHAAAIMGRSRASDFSEKSIN
jgi:hypothetical protein